MTFPGLLLLRDLCIEFLSVPYFDAVDRPAHGKSLPVITKGSDCEGTCLQCFDPVGWAAGRASVLQKN